MKNKKITFYGVLPLIISCANNPFKKYADDFCDVKWVCELSSDCKIELFVLKECKKYGSLCVIQKNSSKYYFEGDISNSLTINKYDEFGKLKCCVLNTSVNYLNENNEFVAHVEEINHDYLTNIDIKSEEQICFEMELFDSKEEAKAIMFSNCEFNSNDYSFSTIMMNDSFIDYRYTFFVSYGTMIINDKIEKIGLCFESETEYFVFKGNNVKDVVFSGTYSNDWTEITLNLDTNNIDDKETLKINATFLND